MNSTIGPGRPHHTSATTSATGVGAYHATGPHLATSPGVVAHPAAGLGAPRISDVAPRHTTGSDRPLGLDTLVRLKRRQPAAAPAAPAAMTAITAKNATTNTATTRRLPLPEGMTVPLGCDAVAVPDRLGPLVAPRLPRLGCVYTDGARWWWIVPADSDDALPWPAPAHYAPGALVPGIARLIHRPEGTVPYTPPIPLYLALCRVTGTTPDWSRAVSA